MVGGGGRGVGGVRGEGFVVEEALAEAEEGGGVLSGLEGRVAGCHLWEGGWDERGDVVVV